MKNILKILRKTLKPRLIMPIAAIAFVASCFIYADNVLAATTTQSVLDEAMMQIQQSVNMGFGLIHAIFWPVLMLIGSLMDNDLIFGVGAGERLRSIWVIIRNLVNIVFVFVLLVIAFYNVTGLGGEGNMALKTILPKFVIALIAVNFSFFICKVILDAANVVTIAVYDIADSVTQDSESGQMQEDMKYYVCTNPEKLSCESASEAASTGCTDSGSTAEEAAEGGASESEAAADCESKSPYWDYSKAGLLAKAFCCNSENAGTDAACQEAGLTFPGTYDKEVGPALSSWGQSFFTKMDQNNIGLVMAINLGSLNKLTEVSATQTTITLKDLTINTLFSVIMYLVFGLAYVALAIVLLARLVVLWLVIALSPIIALTYVIPQVGQYVSELKLGEKFLQHVMAPIAIGLAMSIGYLMTSQVKASGGGGIQVGGLGNLKICDLTSGDATGALLTTNVSDIQQLMIAGIAVAVVWLGVFGAADKTIANSITNGIKDAGTRAVKFTGSLLKYVPFVPVATRGKEAERFSFADISGVLNKAYAIPEIITSQKVSQYAKEWMPSVYGEQSEEFDNLMTRFNTGDKLQKGDTIKTLLQGKISTDEQAKGVADALRNAGVAVPEDIDNIDTLNKFKRWYTEKGGRKAISDKFNVDLTGTNFTAGASDTTEGAATQAQAGKQGKPEAAAGTTVTVDKVIQEANANPAQVAAAETILAVDGTPLTQVQLEQLKRNNGLTADNFDPPQGGKIKVKAGKESLYAGTPAQQTQTQPTTTPPTGQQPTPPQQGTQPQQTPPSANP